MAALSAYAWRCLSALRRPQTGYDLVYATCPFVVETIAPGQLQGRGRAWG